MKLHRTMTTTKTTTKRSKTGTLLEPASDLRMLHYRFINSEIMIFCPDLALSNAANTMAML